MNKIVLTDRIVSEALQKGIRITDALAQEYEGIIADKIKDNPKLEKLDAFEMAMLDAGISKKTMIKDFYSDPQNEWLFPAFIDKKLAETIGNNEILNYIVSGQTTVNSLSVQGASVDLINDADNKEAVKFKRVAEGSDLPLAVIKLGERAITLSKFGRAIQATYESLMFQTVDIFTKSIEWIANDAAGQQISKAVDVLINGDGNSNAATVDTIEGDSGLTPAEIITFALNFYEANKTPLRTIIAPKDMFKSLQQMFVSTTSTNGIIPGSTFNFPQGISQNVTVIFADVPKAGTKSQLIGIDNNYALTKYVAAGSQIREIDRNIRNQTQIGTISEIAGFAKFVNSATRVLRAK